VTLSIDHLRRCFAQFSKLLVDIRQLNLRGHVLRPARRSMPQLPAALARLSVRLPVIVVGGAVVAALAVGVMAYTLARAAGLRQLEANLVATVETRAIAAQRLWRQAETNVRLVSEMPTVLEALETLESDIRTKREGAQAQLHTLYIDQNPFPEAERHRYNGEKDETSYGFYHEKVHRVLDQSRQLFEFSDLYVVSRAGTVVYSAAKRRDFVADLSAGPLKDSGLGSAVKAALAAVKTGDPAGPAVAIVDFAPYAPAAGAPRAFLARAVMKDGAPVGVAAVQLGPETLSGLVNRPIGETGLVYAVGPDGALRTMLPGGIAAAGPPPAGMLGGAGGGTRVGRAAGLGGHEAVVVGVPIDVGGSRWTLVGEQAVSEVEKPMIEMGWMMAMLGAAILAAVAAVGWLAARGVYRPVEALTESVSRLARGDKTALPGVARRDEIGDLARAMGSIHAAGEEAARIRSALDGCPTNIMVTDNAGTIVYANRAVSSLFRAHIADFRSAVPSFDPDAVVGKPMAMFHRNPAHQQRMMDRLATSHVSRVGLGSRTFDLAVSPVLGRGGERLGVMLEWRDISADLAAQSEVAAVAAAAAAGDFTRRIPLEGKTGFMRELSTAMNEIGAVVDNATRDFSEVMAAVAAGDLTRHVESGYDGAFGDLKDAVNTTVARLSETVRTIQTTAVDVATAATQITSGADDLSKRTEEQASSLEETAATTEELAASVKTSAQSSRQAVELAEQAMKLAGTGGSIVTQAVSAMARIEQAGQKISAITTVIDDIAFQTNLLALNAAVEAARAGEAGKGFAVVASEVRTLAQRSAAAAKDITTLIDTSTGAVSEGVKLVRSAGDALGTIVDASQKVAGTVTEISAASNEQARGIDEMSQAVAHMDEMTQQNAALAEESAASAVSLTQQIQRLNDLVAAFRTGGGSHGDRSAHGPARTVRPAPASEPERLRRLARDAFAGGREAPAAWPRQRAAAGGQGSGQGSGQANGDVGWEEF
jgi:methyl-accepting chemotaxis protein